MKQTIQECLVSESEMLAGGALASFETTSAESGIQAYIEEHFEAFQRYSEGLSPFDRQILTEYYHLGKTEEQLAMIHSMSQPSVCRAIEDAERRLGNVIRGKPPRRVTIKRQGLLQITDGVDVGGFVITIGQQSMGVELNEPS